MQKFCFVIMGYGKKTDPVLGKTYDLDITYQNIIKPAVEQAGYQCIRGDEVLESGMIDKSMYALLIKADLVIADITTFNPNAIYELGIRHAARPFSTIIMKEKDGNIPFDLNHNKTFTYSHMGEDIGYSETTRCVQALKKLIESVERSKEIDSPLFHHIPSVQPYILPEDEYIQIIKDLVHKEKTIFALVENAKHEMRNENFEVAASLWEKAAKKIENDAYFIQQWALCTYKNQNIEPEIALTNALTIINQLNPTDRNTTDPETLGITGAIYKRLWLLNPTNTGYLDKAIEFYKKGFLINQDYYTGENYALCLEFKANASTGDEKIYFQIEAKNTRKKIISIVESLKQDEDFYIRSDLKWIYATLANCHLALGEAALFAEYQTKFRELDPASWEIETFEQSISQLQNM